MTIKISELKLFEVCGVMYIADTYGEL